MKKLFSHFRDRLQISLEFEVLFSKFSYFNEMTTKYESGNIDHIVPGRHHVIISLLLTCKIYSLLCITYQGKQKKKHENKLLLINHYFDEIDFN